MLDAGIKLATFTFSNEMFKKPEKKLVNITPDHGTHFLTVTLTVSPCILTVHRRPSPLRFFG